MEGHKKIKMTIEEIEKAYTQGRKQGWADKDAWIKERVRRLKKEVSEVEINLGGY